MGIYRDPPLCETGELGVAGVISTAAHMRHLLLWFVGTLVANAESLWHKQGSSTAQQAYGQSSIGQAFR